MKRLVGVMVLGVSGLAMAGGMQSAGNAQDAAKQREARAADIAFWTSGYKGEDLVSGRFSCPAPSIPDMSKTKSQIKSVSDSYQAWQQCYNGFVANLNETMSRGSRIPADVAALLTPQEAQQAAAHVDRVHEGLIAQAQQNASQVLAKYDAWQGATERYVKSDNTARRLEYDMAARRQQEGEAQRYPQPGAQPVPSPATMPGPGR